MSSSPRKVDDVGYPCPACGATGPFGQLRMREGRFEYTGCLKCAAVWESLPPGEPYSVDDELMPFDEPCDNCAFRPGSAESADKLEWRKLLEQLKRGGTFYCHKGVPLKVEPETNRVLGFDYPPKEEMLDRGRMCRGFLNAWKVWIRQERDQVRFTCTAGDLEEGGDAAV